MNNKQMHVKYKESFSAVKKNKGKEIETGYGLSWGGQGKCSNYLLLHDKTPQTRWLKQQSFYYLLSAMYWLGSSRWFFCSLQIFAGASGFCSFTELECLDVSLTHLVSWQGGWEGWASLGCPCNLRTFPSLGDLSVWPFAWTFQQADESDLSHGNSALPIF